MGRTVPTFRMALKREILSWTKGYRDALRKEDRATFDEIINKARLHGDAGTMSGKPVINEVLVMNILLELQKQVLKLKAKIKEMQEKLETIQASNL